MDNLPPDASVEDINDEIIFQQAMLESLGEGDDDRRQEVEKLLVELEDQMEARQAEDEMETGQSSGDSTRRSSTTSTIDTDGMPAIPGSFPLPRLAQVQRLDGATSTSNSAASSSTSLSHSTKSAAKRPRHLSESIDAESMRNKRPSHSGFGRASQMGSQSGEQRLAALIERQRAAEAAAEAKRQAQKADEDLARMLSQQNASPSFAGPSRSSFSQSAPKVETSPSQWHSVFRPQGYRKPKRGPSPTPMRSDTTPMPQPNFQFAMPSPHTPSFAGSSRIKPEPYPMGTSPSQRPNIKAETSMQASNNTPNRYQSNTGVIDLTESDSDAEVVDLTGPKATSTVEEMHRMARRNEFDERLRQHNANLAQQRQLVEQRMRTEVQNPQAFAQLVARQRQLYDQQRILAQQQAARFASQPYVYGQYATGLPGSSSTASAVKGSGGRMPNFFDIATAADRGTGYADPDGHYDPYNTMRRMQGFPSPMDYDDHDADPEEVREELLKLVDNIQPDVDSKDVVDEDVEVEGLTIKLKPYQDTGLKWLQKMEEGTNKGGILADDMGLGKTVQAIALMVTRRSEDPTCKTTLILAPVALLRQWEQEIASKIRRGRHTLRTFIHHSTHKAKSHSALCEYDVVLTTYGTIAAEHKKMERYLARKKIDPEAQPRADEKCMFIGPECRWYRCIIDEAQCIKNRSTRTARASFEINAKSRFCMTGTPMMNSVEELYSLIQFLRIRPYNNWNKFRMDFVAGMKGREEFRQGAMTKLQILLKAILLRRNKKTQINGKPILTLPERTVEMVHPVFNDDEQAFYTALETQSAITVNRYLEAGTVGKQYAHVLLLLLRLRQACCHPHLIKDYGIVGAAADITPQAMDDLCKTLDAAVISRIKEANGAFECPICYDAVENPAIFHPCGHDACSECFTRMTDPSQTMQNGDSEGHSRCPVCRAPIDTKKVVDYECFKRVHMPAAVTAEGPLEGLLPDDVETESDDSDSDSDFDSDDDNDGTLGGFIVRDGDEMSTESEAEETDDDGEAAESAKRAKAAKAAKAAKQKKSKKAKGKRRATGKPLKADLAKMSLPELKKAARTSKAHKRYYMNKITKNFQPSAKTTKTIELLEPIMESPENEKIIIFSQWTTLLDLVEIPIHKKNWGFCRYDGSMNAKARADAVDDFKAKPNLRIMLVSLKAGNAGLNLNIANQVILLDPFWNPYIEEQAIDRAHRLGQTREVKVHRVLVEKTVEDRIIELQEKKRGLISQALDEKAGQSVARLSARDLAFLFGINRSAGNAAPAQGRR